MNVDVDAGWAREVPLEHGTDFPLSADMREDGMSDGSAVLSERPNRPFTVGRRQR